MDKLHSTHKEIVQQISFKHTLKVLDGFIHAVFYDVTTIYFEIEKEDDIRIPGFSKDGKHKNPQIVLGLLVSKDAYPLAYEFLKGTNMKEIHFCQSSKAFVINTDLKSSLWLRTPDYFPTKTRRAKKKAMNLSRGKD